jgi:hypothetical protein
MAEYDITFKVDILISRSIHADSLDAALEAARKLNNPAAIFEPKRLIEYIDGDIEVKGVYEL